MIVTEILGDGATYEKITPGDTATGFASAVLSPTSGLYKGMTAKGALITCQGNTQQFTFNGTAPTAAAGTDYGHPIDAGQSYTIRGANNVRNFRTIDRVSGSAGSIKGTLLF